jgi:hypothetical protein
MNVDPFELLARTEQSLRPQRVDQPQAVSMELVALREFFKAWEALHGIQGDKRTAEVRAKYEQAAQTLVDAADAVKSVREQNG